MLDLRDALYKCTTNKTWVCLIEGRMLVGSGSHSSGKSAWSRKCDAARVFKESAYWRYIKYGLKKKYKGEIPENDFYYNRGCAKKILDEEYKKLLSTGVVKYIELTPVPEMLNNCNL